MEHWLENELRCLVRLLLEALVLQLPRSPDVTVDAAQLQEVLGLLTDLSHLGQIVDPLPVQLVMLLFGINALLTVALYQLDGLFVIKMFVLTLSHLTSDIGQVAGVNRVSGDVAVLMDDFVLGEVGPIEVRRNVIRSDYVDGVS